MFGISAYVLNSIFITKCQSTSKPKDIFLSNTQQISLRAQEFYICKFSVNRDRRTRCTNSWSNLTLKCNTNTFVKVDAQIEENCRRTFLPKASVARNWVIRNLWRIQFDMQEEQLYAKCGDTHVNFTRVNKIGEMYGRSRKRYSWTQLLHLRAAVHTSPLLYLRT